MQRRELVIGAGAAALLGAHASLFAQEFPRQGMSIRYIVPFPPGGLTDVMARSVGQKLSEALKVPVVVENKAGGNAQIGADQVAKSPPDGTSLLGGCRALGWVRVGPARGRRQGAKRSRIAHPASICIAACASLQAQPEGPGRSAPPSGVAGSLCGPATLRRRRLGWQHGSPRRGPNPKPDSLLAITLTHAANVTLFPDAPYSFMNDLRPVALLAGSPMLVVVPASSPISDFRDLMKVAKARQLNAGSSGNGTPPHLTMALFNDINQSTMTHVPYRGGAPSMTDLMGGQLDIIFSNFPESIAHVKGGKLRALALCSPTRNAAVPDVPTTIEAGMPALQVENWTAAMIQSRTPDAIVQRFSREMVRIMGESEMAERATQQGFRISARGADEFGAFLKSEVERWARIIKSAKITAG